MSTLYKEIFKQNNNKIKELTGEYKINCEQLVKELRSYAIKTQSTEKVVEEMIDELCQGYNRNIRFTTLVVNKEEYLNNYKLFFGFPDQFLQFFDFLLHKHQNF